MKTKKLRSDKIYRAKKNGFIVAQLSAGNGSRATVRIKGIDDNGNKVQLGMGSVHNNSRPDTIVPYDTTTVYIKRGYRFEIEYFPFSHSSLNAYFQEL